MPSFSKGGLVVATGRSSKLVGQAGEYIVAGELARRGYISTTFAGNVPEYDIICSSVEGHYPEEGDCDERR